MGPVFLFYVGVIVFVIGTASGELDGVFSVGEVSQEVVVEEFGAVIAIEAEQGEGECLFDVFELFQDAGFTLSPGGPLFSPAGGDIHAVDGIGEHTGYGFSAMGDGIGFEESGAGFVPLVGFNGDMFFQEGAWFCGGAASCCIVDSGRGKESVDSGRRDAQ